MTVNFKNIFGNLTGSLLAILLTGVFALAANAQVPATLAELIAERDTIQAETTELAANLAEAERSLTAAETERDTLQTDYDAWSRVAPTLGDNMPEAGQAVLDRYTELADEISGLTSKVERLAGVIETNDEEVSRLAGEIGEAADAAIADTVTALLTATVAKATAEAKVASLQAQLELAHDNIAILETERNTAYLEMADNCDRNGGLIACSGSAHQAAIAWAAENADPAASQVAENGN